MDGVFLWIFSPIVVLAQVPSWVTTIGGKQNEIAYKMQHDRQGNLYLVGSFEDTLQVGNFLLVSKGLWDIFIAKYAPDGKLIWVKSIGGDSYDVGYCLSIDSLNNLYIVGYFSDTVDFNPDNDIYLTSSQGNLDGFLLKLASSGRFQWVRTFGGNGMDVANSIALCGHQIVISGWFEGSAILGAAAAVSNGLWDGFLCAYDTSGTPLWSKTFGGRGYDKATMVIAHNNTYFLSATFQDTLQLKNQEVISLGGSDGLWLQYDTLGNLIQFQAFGSSAEEQCNAIAVDSLQNIYVVGSYGASLAVSSTIILPFSGMTDGFCIQYNKNGQPQWATAIRGTGRNEVKHIAIDPYGAIFLTGFFQNTAAIPPYSLQSQGKKDLFLVKYDPQGNPIWTFSVGSSQDERGQALLTNPLTLLGTFSQPLQVGNFTLNHQGQQDVFITRIYDLNATTTASQIATIKFYPNPVKDKLYLQLPYQQGTITITNNQGKTLLHAKWENKNYFFLSLSHLAPGIYYLKIQVRSHHFTFPFIKE